MVDSGPQVDSRQQVVGREKGQLVPGSKFQGQRDEGIMQRTAEALRHSGSIKASKMKILQKSPLVTLSLSKGAVCR